MSRNPSRYAHVSKRAKSSLVKGSFFLSAAALFPGLACGNNDADVIAAASTVPAVTTATPAPDATTLTTAPASEAPASDTGSGTAVSETAELQVDFSFSAQGDRLKNPYVAVWVEDVDGNLVDTIAVWYQQDDKGTKWIKDLKRWYTASESGQNGGETSSATRSPGDYSLLWDATDTSGAKVAAGDYFVCIEASREHGPYELIREPMTLGADGFTLELPDANELINASAAFRA